MDSSISKLILKQARTKRISDSSWQPLKWPHMDQLEFFQPGTDIPDESQTRLVAGTLHFNIELIEALSAADAEHLIRISGGLTEFFGEGTAFTRKTIRRYFNYPHTLPFVGRLRDHFIGFLVGVPLENFSGESWAQSDPTLGEHVTVYTYAFIFEKRYRKSGYAKMLKRVYLNWLKKRGYAFVSGHVREGIAQGFSSTTRVMQKFPNWHDTGKVFEYYQRPLT